jgi:DNA-binding transcriptional LysR family regulator
MGRSQRYKELQLPQLRGFCLAATEGNFTSAAKMLGLSPSTIWQQVRALERQFKARLLRRRGRAVELTDEGRALLDLIQPHVTGLDSLRRLFEDRRTDLPRQLTVASGIYLHHRHLPAPIRQFRAEWPSVQVNVRVAAWSALQRLMERDEADLAVLACDPDLPRSPYLEYEHLFDEQLTLMAPAEHPLTRIKHLTPRELVKHPFILPPKGGADRKALDRLFRKHNLFDQLRTVMVCGLVDLTTKYVRMRMGVALMYVSAAAVEDMPGVHLRTLDPEIERLPIEMAVRKGAHLPEYVAAFQRLVRQSLSEEGRNRKGRPGRSDAAR